MLEMAHGIPDEEVFGLTNEIPSKGGVGRRMVRNHGRFVELENCLGGLFLLPERLREFETGPMEAGSAFATMTSGVFGAEVGGRRWEMGI